MTIAAGEKIHRFGRWKSPYPRSVKMDLLPVLLKAFIGFSSRSYIIPLLFARRACEDQRCPERRFPKAWVWKYLPSHPGSTPQSSIAPHLNQEIYDYPYASLSIPMHFQAIKKVPKWTMVRCFHPRSSGIFWPAISLHFVTGGNIQTCKSFWMILNSP